MWARVLECLVAIWLFVSPTILPYFVHETLLQNSHLVIPFLIVIFSLFSFHSAFRKIHLVNFLLGVWLLGLGYIAYPLDPLPSQENSVVVGLLIMLFSLVPTHRVKSEGGSQKAEVKKNPS